MRLPVGALCFAGAEKAMLEGGVVVPICFALGSPIRSPEYSIRACQIYTPRESFACHRSEICREVRMTNVVANNVRLPDVSIKGMYHMPRTS
jgi:hypothetical protein